MEGNKLVDYNDYFVALSKYKKVEVNEQEKALLFKIMNDLDITGQLGSYLKFRDKDHSVEIQSLAMRFTPKGYSKKEKPVTKRLEKIQTNFSWHILCTD